MRDYKRILSLLNDFYINGAILYHELI